ncbi:hypothetical protein OKW40_000679 [Paraburkholderia sp. RAU6.4a]|uniref:hypothetical protein n=1 Tax=Paraburkholderia sp. RAU6.4a TaxID=2991067 RepID=UPI003D1CA6C2
MKNNCGSGMDAESNSFKANHTDLGWSGLAWGSLPYESTVSIVWRFAWRNALTGTEVWKLSRISAGKRHPPPFFGQTLQDPGIRRLATGTGLILPLPEEWRLIGRTNCIGQIFRVQLSLCPICAQSAYHTFLFQLPFLHVCPVHNVPLTTVCQSCGAPSPDYKFTPEFFQSDWGCAHCHEAIAGQAPDLLDFLDLREHAQALKRAFSPLVHWIEEVNRSAAGFERLTLCPHAPRRYARTLLESAICAVRRPPDLAIAPHFKVLCLNWHLRLRPPRPEVRINQTERDDCPYSGSSNLTEFFAWLRRRIPSTIPKREPYSSRQCTTVLVYEGTIWRIRQWLIERHIRLGLETSLHDCPRFEHGRVITAGWDKCELSYLLLRLWCERGVERNWTVAAGPITGSGCICPSFAAVGDRVLRIPLRAAILAAYGTVVCTVGASKLAGDFLTLPPRDRMETMMAYEYQTDYLHHTGLVIMPVIEDLMTRFPEIRSKLDENWSDRWTRISEAPFFRRRSHVDFQPARRLPLP